MKKEHTYVKCNYCAWELEQGVRDWIARPCSRCANTRQVVNPKEILCNMCGESMCPDITVLSGKWWSEEPHGLYQAKVSGGYESYHLLDLNTYNFSFCEACLRKLFNQCKVKPEIYDAIDHSPIPWEDDQDIYENRIWRDDGGHHKAYLERKCNRHRDCNKEAVYTVMLSDEFTEDSACEEHKKYWNDCVNAKLVKFIPNVLKAFL